MVEKYKLFFNEIIISTYKNNSLQLKKIKDNNFVKIIENEIPTLKGIHNSQNIYLQCLSSFHGLKLVKSKYSVKLRSDEFYSNLEKLILSLPSNKISTSNIFVRDIHYKFFHLSDHLIIGKTDILKKSFFNLMKYIEDNSKTKSDNLKILTDRIPAETKITLFTLFELENNKFDNWYNFDAKKVYYLLVKHFYIFSVDNLTPYTIKASAIGEIQNYKDFVNEDVILGLRYISSINELFPRNFMQRFVDKRKLKLRKLKKKIVYK